MQAELTALKNNELNEKEAEIESLRSNNHILEEKLRLMSTKLEISKKDCLEKDSLLKKMTNSSNMHEQDTQLFHNLALEIQKQVQSLQEFTNQTAHNFSFPHVSSDLKDLFPHKTTIETVHTESISHQIPPKEGIIKANVHAPQHNAAKEQSQTNQFINVPTLSSNDPTKDNKSRAPPSQLKENPAPASNNSNNSPLKESHNQQLLHNPNANKPVKELIKENIPSQIQHTKQEEHPVKPVEKPFSKEASPIKKQPEKEESTVKEVHNEIPPPPPPTKKETNNIMKKAEEQANINKKIPQRPFAAGAFNHPKINNRQPQKPFSSKN